MISLHVEVEKSVCISICERRFTCLNTQNILNGTFL